MIVIPELPWLYPIFTTIGILLGALIRRMANERLPLPDRVQNLYFAIIACAAIGGAYLPEVWSIVLHLPDDGGRSLITALLVAYVTAEVVKCRLGISFPTGDGFAVALPLATGISRFGCLFAHCCTGVPTHATFALLEHGEPCVPIVVYEIVFHLSWAVIGGWLTMTNRASGDRLRYYVLAYCFFRFVTEWWRPHPPLMLGLSVYQIMSLILASVVIWILTKPHLSKPRMPLAPLA